MSSKALGVPGSGTRAGREWQRISTCLKIFVSSLAPLNAQCCAPHHPASKAGRCLAVGRTRLAAGCRTSRPWLPLRREHMPHLLSLHSTHRASTDSLHAMNSNTARYCGPDASPSQHKSEETERSGHLSLCLFSLLLRLPTLCRRVHSIRERPLEQLFPDRCVHPAQTRPCSIADLSDVGVPRIACIIGIRQALFLNCISDVDRA